MRTHARARRGYKVRADHPDPDPRFDVFDDGTPDKFTITIADALDLDDVVGVVQRISWRLPR